MTWYFFESGEETASEEGVECLVVVGRLALGVPPNTRGEAGAVVGGCCLRCFREGSGEALLAWGVDGVAVVVGEVVVVVATVSSAGSIVAIFFICCHLTLTLSFLPPKKNNND